METLTTPDNPAALERWIETFPERDGIRYLSSARSFGGSEVGEEEYARQFGVGEDYLDRVALGISHVLAAADADSSQPALEIGCGTGIFTRPLVTGTAYPTYYISDMSPVFVDATRRAVSNYVADQRVEYLVLSSEEFDRWPERSLSLIAMRYVLHHVLDWPEFIAHAARLLVRGGVLVFEEPIADGFLLQAMLMRSLQARLDELGCSENTRREINYFIGALFWYLRTDVDKSQSEDKHVFQPSQLFAVGGDLALRTRFYQNFGFDEVAVQSEPRPCYFGEQFRHNVKVNFGFSEETVALFDQHLAPLCRELEAVSGAVNGPIVKGIFTFTKTA